MDLSTGVTRRVTNSGDVLFQDQYGNIANVDWFGTEAEAQKSLESLVGCINCRNCTNCVRCVGCDRCFNCVLCMHGTQLSHCLFCDGCNQCTQCNYCRGCALLTMCWGLAYRSDLHTVKDMSGVAKQIKDRFSERL